MADVTGSDSRPGHFGIVDFETRKAAKGVTNIIRKAVGEKARKVGYVYVVQEKDESHIKIGWSKTLNGSRSAAPKACGFKIVERHHTPFILGAFRCEKIVHALLGGFRHDYHKCECDTVEKHREWFRVSVQDALNVVELVHRWLSTLPYENKEGGNLEDIWKARLDSFENSLETKKPNTIDQFFKQDKQSSAISEFGWQVLLTQHNHTPRKDLSFVQYHLLGEYSPRSGTKSRGLPTEQTPTQDAKPRLLSPSSTPSKRLTRASAPPGSQSSDKRRSRLEETPSKNGSTKKSSAIKKSRSPYREKDDDTDEGFVVDDHDDRGDDDYTDHTDDDELQSQSKDGSGDEEDEAEDDTNIDICCNSLAGLSLTERLARVKIGETPLACEKQSGTRKSGPKVKARRGTRASATLSSQEQSEEDSDLVRVRGKGRRDLALGPRTAKQLSKGLPKFSRRSCGRPCRVIRREAQD